MMRIIIAIAALAAATAVQAQDKAKKQVQARCESLASADNVAPDKRKAYIDTCVKRGGKGLSAREQKGAQKTKSAEKKESKKGVRLGSGAPASK